VSRPVSLQLPDDVRSGDIVTPRGTFAGLSCRPDTTSMPRGSVLLVPGFTGSKEDFAELLPLLASAGWAAASYDQRGQFQTPGGPHDDFSLSGFAADAVEVSAALFGRDERVHLVGHSFGGLVAGAAAIEYEDVWASLVLLCSGPGGLGGERAGELHAAAEMATRDGLEELYRASAERDARLGVQPPPAEIERFMHTRFVANSPQGLAAIARVLADTPDHTHALASLDLRTLVLRGESDDAWPHDVQDRLAAAVGTRVVVIDGAAHSPAVEQPEPTRDALVRFWLG
jgi:pimeloyl-ACP methyl ester carboxylesterase